MEYKLNKILRSHIIKNILPIFLVIVVILIGIIKVNIINTKALSPLGNTNENYKLVSKEFGEDFSDFIKDSSFLKIYKESNNDLLVRVGNTDFKIRNESVITQKLEKIIEKFKL